MQDQYCFLTILLLICSISCFKVIETKRTDSRSFSENCTSFGEACDKAESLLCINGTCQCNNPLDMTYDTARGLCVGRANKPCVNHLSEQRVPSLKRNQCVSYSSCEKTEFGNFSCLCWSSFYPNDEGYCVRQQDYLHKCQKDSHCNSRKGFVCHKDLKICTCDPEVATFNPLTERCVGRPNHQCANSYGECTKNYKCRAGICRCKYRETESENGTLLCVPEVHKYRKSCGRFRGDCGNELLNNLRCLDGKCRCKNPDHQVYDYDRKMCVSKVGGPCTSVSNPSEKFRNGTENAKFDPSTFPIVQCVAYAKCKSSKTKFSTLSSENYRSTLSGICECEKTFVETNKGYCSLPFGAHCDTGRKNKKDKCSSPLRCVNGRCACPNEIDIFETDVKKCAKPVGAVCTKNNACVKNSRCRRRKKHLPGRCSCRSKYTHMINGTCLLDVP